MEFAKKYNHKTQETYWQNIWRDSQVYAWRGDASRENTYVIDTPPPTVSGLLHMGHIFSYTHADFIARYQRMKGKDVFYPMGFDDNGLPTERLVEKTTKKRASDYETREEFIAVCERVSVEARKEFRSLFERAALSIDWQQEYHTISDDVRTLSQQSFLDLCDKGEIYRKEQPMLWDPVDQTAIAQAEVEDKELEGTFNDIRFDVAGSEENFVIGTTRPEMLPACVAIFYHPDDARYKHLSEKQAVVPLFGHHVPILTDDTVEPDKGTGIMMCCTFGDEADIEKWKTHDLPLRLILNKYGKLDLSALDDITSDEAVLSPLQHVKTKVARPAILEMLERAGHLVASKPITHAVKCAERSGAPLEILPTKQWFVQVIKHKAALHEKNKRCNWNPAWMAKRLEQWIDGLHWDWCISRQRYYGVPFPVWYSTRAGEEGKILLAAPHQLPVNPLTDLPEGYSADEVIPDADVMDTWATSSLSPHINARGISADTTPNVPRFRSLFPADLRPQAHEIIRSWAFYTLVKAHLHNDDVPWHNLMISGWCLASDKTKMSKSKGNVVTPVGLLEDKSADAVRYWASTANLGTDTAFSEDQLKIGAKLVNKLWNASKFVALQLANLDGIPQTAAADIERGIITETVDLWLIARTHHIIRQYDEQLAQYNYSVSRSVAETLFWNDFCDNYLELVKSRAYGNMGSEKQQSACYTLYHVLKALLKLFAPFVPHITEEIYATMYAGAGSIHQRGTFPVADEFTYDEALQETGQTVTRLLELVRKAKSERNVSIKYPITQAYIAGVDADILIAIADDLKAAGNIATMELRSNNATPDGDTYHISDEQHSLSMHLVFAKEADVA